jgi:hypothetical protein
LYHRLIHQPTGRPRHCTFSDGLIVLAYFVAVLNGRSVLWASDRRHWPIWCWRLTLPGRSQLNKRLRSPSVLRLIEAINRQLRERLPRGDVKLADGKPLTVGGFSHDPDARVGKTPGGFGRGYKLHAIVDAAAATIDAFTVLPLHLGEATALRHLARRTDLRGMTLLADANYDSNRTYAVIARSGGRLIAPRRKPRTGLGHGRHPPDRLRAVQQLEHGPGRVAHRRDRNRIEQTFACLTNLPFGLAPLPNFVRRLCRVRRWVLAKITLYHLRQVLARQKVQRR